MKRLISISIIAVLAGVGFSIAIADEKSPSDRATPTTAPAQRTLIQRPGQAKVKGRPASKLPKVKLKADEKREKDSARFHVFRLLKEAKKKFVCAGCNGTGRQIIRVPDGDAGRLKSPREVTCAVCEGTCIAPTEGVQAALAAYYSALFNFEAKYPSDSPLKTDLERWIVGNVTSDQAVMRLNADGAKKLQSGRKEVGDVYVLGVEAFGLQPRSKVPLVQAFLHPRVDCPSRESLNLMVLFDRGIPDEIDVDTGFVVIAVDLGADYYEGLLGNSIKTRVLSAIWVKKITAKPMPWNSDHP